MLIDARQTELLNAIDKNVHLKCHLELRIAEVTLCAAMVSVLIVVGWGAAYFAHHKLNLFYAFAFDGIAVAAILIFAGLQARCFWLRSKVKALSAQLDQQYLELKPMG